MQRKIIMIPYDIAPSLHDSKPDREHLGDGAVFVTARGRVYRIFTAQSAPEYQVDQRIDL